MMIIRILFLISVSWGQQMKKSFTKFVESSKPFYSMNVTSIWNKKLHSKITCGSLCMTNHGCEGYILSQNGSCSIGKVVNDILGDFEGYIMEGRDLSSTPWTSYYPPVLTNFSFVVRIGGVNFESSSKRAEVEIFDISGQNRICIDQMANLSSPQNSPGAIYTNGTVFYCGGAKNDRCKKYVRQNNSWEEIPGLIMMMTRSKFGSVQSSDGRYWLMFGGLVGDQHQRQSFEILDLYQMKFIFQDTCLADMPNPGATALNRTAFAIVPHDGQVQAVTVYVYDMRRNTWGKLTNRPNPSFKGFFGKITFGNATEALVYSGNSVPIESTIQVLPLEGDIEQQEWRTFQGLQLNKGNTLQFQGTIIAIGGDNQYTGPLYFDVTTMTWEPLVSGVYKKYVTYTAAAPVPDSFCDP